MPATLAEAVVNGNPHSSQRSAVSRIGVIATLTLLSCVLIAKAAAPQGTARSMDIDVSIRSAALGGASNALFWGEERDHWANPALLGYEQGIRYEHGNTPLMPGLASDITFATDVVKIGGSGVGLVFSGQPWDHGGVHLDYGTSQGTDASGNPIGTFGSFERVRSWGFGVSAMAALEAIFSTRGDTRNWDRYADLSFGMNFKDVTVSLAPSVGVEGSTTARDYGVLLRLTPVDGITGPGGPPIRLDLSYGHSELSYNDGAVIDFPSESTPTPVSHHTRDGFGVHVAADPMRDHWPAHGTAGWLGPGLEPLFSFGFTVDHATIEPTSTRTDGNGIEFTFARVFSYRMGHYHDQLGDIDGSTSGWSVGLPIGRWGGGYYEEASFPQSTDSGLSDLNRKGFGLWADAMAIWRSAHHSAPR